MENIIIEILKNIFKHNSIPRELNGFNGNISRFIELFKIIDNTKEISESYDISIYDIDSKKGDIHSVNLSHYYPNTVNIDFVFSRINDSMKKVIFNIVFNPFVIKKIHQNRLIKSIEFYKKYKYLLCEAHFLSKSYPHKYNLEKIYLDLKEDIKYFDFDNNRDWDYCLSFMNNFSNICKKEFTIYTKPIRVTSNSFIIIISISDLITLYWDKMENVIQGKEKLKKKTNFFISYLENSKKEKKLIVEIAKKIFSGIKI